MPLGERNQEARIGRTKVKLGTDVEASMCEGQAGLHPHSKSKGARIRHQGSSERLYKKLLTRCQCIDVATDSQCKNQGEHAPSILDHV